MFSLVARSGPLFTRRIPDLPLGLLSRVRARFLGIAVLAIVIALFDLMRIDTLVSLPGYLAVVAAYVTWAATLYRRGEQWRWLDPAGPVLVGCLGIVAGDYTWAFGAMYGALFLHGTFGGARRTTINSLLYLTAYETAVAVTEGVEMVPIGLVSHAIGIVVVTYLVRTIAGSVRRHDEVRLREELLTRTSAELITATRSEDVARIALAAVAGLAQVAGAGSEHRVTLWRLRNGELEWLGLAGRELATRRIPLAVIPASLLDLYLAGQIIQLGPGEMAELQAALDIDDLFAHGVSVPLVEGGELNGLLFISTTVPLDDDTVVSLQRFMHEVSLADVLVRRQALLGSVVENSADAILLVGPEGTIEFASPAVTGLTGAAPEALVGQPVDELLSRRVDGALVGVADLEKAAQAGYELFVRDLDDPVQVELTLSTLAGDGVVVNLRDITERARLEGEVAYRAFHDPVTGLANRAMFNDRLQHALARADRDGSRTAVALIDLDDFKAVNDVHGHSAGDQLLVETAGRLTEALRRADTPARFGGDEFAVLMERVVDESEVDAVLTRVVAALARPFTVGDRQVRISASIGVRVGEANESADTIVGDADVAMYVAKGQGKNQLVRFEDGMRLAALEQSELKSQLQTAIEHDEFVLHYQPVMDLRTGEVAGLEALVRWESPQRGLVPPDEFIPLAEQSGLIIPLGRWVLEHACAQLAAWVVDGVVGPDARMAVNLSAHQLLAPQLLQDVVGALERAGLTPPQLTLEVTETALMDEPERAGEVLRELSAIGIEIAIDDFGTGYSSFAYLQRFPVDIIKVDRSFVAQVAEGPEPAALAHAIVKLAQTLQMRTIAEGVEDPAQELVLRGWGCSHGQGWHWARAMPAAATTEWLADQDRAARVRP